jgi:hypothetical protein
MRRRGGGQAVQEEVKEREGSRRGRDRLFSPLSVLLASPATGLPKNP